MKKVTDKQREKMLDMLEDNLNIHKGRFSSTVCDEDRQDLWVSIAETLNASGDGPTKPWKLWRKSYADWKSNVKNKLRDNSKARNDTGGGPKKTVLLTVLEERLSAFIAKVQVEGMKGVREGGFPVPNKEKEGPSATEDSNRKERENSEETDHEANMANEDAISDGEDSSSMENQKQPACKRQMSRGNLRQSAKRSVARTVREVVAPKSVPSLVDVLEKYADVQQGHAIFFDKEVSLKQEAIEIERERLDLEHRRIEVEDKKATALGRMATALTDIAEYLKNQD